MEKRVLRMFLALSLTVSFNGKVFAEEQVDQTVKAEHKMTLEEVKLKLEETIAEKEKVIKDLENAKENRKNAFIVTGVSVLAFVSSGLWAAYQSSVKFTGDPSTAGFMVNHGGKVLAIEGVAAIGSGAAGIHYFIKEQDYAKVIDQLSKDILDLSTKKALLNGIKVQP